MYNGIGLQTARGSGTNGYVQRNLGALRFHKDKVGRNSFVNRILCSLIDCLSGEASCLSLSLYRPITKLKIS